MKTALRVFLAFALVMLLSCSMNLPDPRRFAIVFGINTYPGNNLQYPVADAISFCDMLLSHGYTVILETEAGATKAQLRKDVASFAASMGPDDFFIFYYSGHGTQFPYQGVDRELILPYGSVDTYDGSVIESDSIYDAELGVILDALPTKRKVIILDSCYSGGFVGNTLEVDRTPPAFLGTTEGVSLDVISRAIQNYTEFQTQPANGISPYNALVISAAGTNEFSFDWPEHAHGVFTYFLLQAPSSADLNNDGAVTALEAFAYVKAQLNSQWNKYASISPAIDPNNPDPLLHNTFSPHVSGGPIDYVLF